MFALATAKQQQQRQWMAEQAALVFGFEATRLDEYIQRGVFPSTRKAEPLRLSEEEQRRVHKYQAAIEKAGRFVMPSEVDPTWSDEYVEAGH